MSNEKKSQQLGMSFSKASGQLKKMYLLHLLQRLGEDDCFRCGEKITSIEDLSIEHKQPWLDVSVDLFWDLMNIAHSHLSCNSRSSRRNTSAMNDVRRANAHHIVDWMSNNPNEHLEASVRGGQNSRRNSGHTVPGSADAQRR